MTIRLAATIRPTARAIVAVNAALGLALAVFSPAEAAAPEQFPVEMHGSGTVDCGTFQDNFTDDAVGDATVFFDSTGEVSRVVIHWTHTSTDTNSATGLVLHEHGHYTETFNLVRGTHIFTGNQEILNRPGFGAILQDTGRQVYDADGNLIFFAGGHKHSQVLLGDQPFCVGLA